MSKCIFSRAAPVAITFLFCDMTCDTKGNDHFYIILIFTEKHQEDYSVIFAEMFSKVCTIWCVGQNNSAALQYLSLMVVWHTHQSLNKYFTCLQFKNCIGPYCGLVEILLNCAALIFRCCIGHFKSKFWFKKKFKKKSFISNKGTLNSSVHRIEFGDTQRVKWWAIQLTQSCFKTGH